MTSMVAGLVFASSCASKLDVPPQNDIYEEQVIELIQQGGETAINMIKSMQAPMPKYLNF